MGRMFDKKGRLNIPLSGGPQMLGKRVEQKGDQVIVKEAFCPEGHNLVSDIEVDGEKGLHLIYTNDDGTRETEVVLSPVLRACSKTILHGEAFKNGEIIKILCPDCRTQLPILVNCECGAPIYLFFLDKDMDRLCGHSLCSRVGCNRASQLRYAEDVFREAIKHVSF